VTAASLGPPRGASANWRSLVHQRRALVPAGALLMAALIACGGFAVGSHQRTTHVVDGYAYASTQQITASAGGWSYEIPLDVPWLAAEADGGWHDGSRPSCLAPGNARIPVKFAWVPVHAGTVSWRAVAWVDCR
jgi:hypothetical protein